MNRKLYITALLTLFMLKSSYSQQTCILAGDRTLFHYTDLVPDSMIIPTSTNGTWSYYLDVNNDNITDFIIADRQAQTGWYSEGYAYISAVGNNKILVNSSNAAIPDTLTAGSPICSDGLWDSLGRFVHSVSYSFGGGGYSYLEWYNRPDKYVGLKIVKGADSVYGWVQIFCNGVPVIKDFACDIFPIESGIIGLPNPTNDFINIYVANDNSSLYTLQLYNTVGDIVYENYGNEKKIDVHAMPAGIYVLRLITKDQTSSQKIVITSK